MPPEAGSTTSLVKRASKIAHKNLTSDALEKQRHLQGFGRELKQRRRERNLKAYQLAEKIGTSPQWVSAVERAYAREERTPITPSDENLQKISRVLEWPLVQINIVLGRIAEAEVEEALFHALTPEGFGKILKKLSHEDLQMARKALMKEELERYIQEEKVSGSSDP